MSNVLYADLGRVPATYDFISFLCGYARDYDEPTDLVLVEGEADGFRPDDLWPRGREARKAMLDRVVIPMAWMLPQVCSVTISPPRSAPRPRWGAAVLISAFKRGARPLRSRLPVEARKPYVTITLREAEHWPGRNSNLPEWLRAADEIEALGFEPIFIRDTCRADEPLERSDRLAALSLERRAQLYAGAALNLGVNNGPIWLACAMDTPVIVVKPTADAPKSATAAFLARSGMTPGQPHPWGAEHQTVIWAEDRAEIITAAVRRHLQR